ncbi:hypothetical protein LN042_23970 [Kitasatospora sp. RB6PN24]|uniref:hypothetical protein n=1 Tax=Kitasatospora humi TaxID=2893891 RepID=UPI001E390EB4|nr:hypothetical protein [Kitasatospora humi]MCC9310087.1 hypothetical protein [Kitasatospora humi]
MQQPARLALAAAALSLIAAGCGLSTKDAASGDAGAPDRVVGSVVTAPPGSCHYRGALPDPACTPGEADSRVAPDTIKATICAPGWSKAARPPTSVTGPIKAERIRAYATPLPAKSVALDHLLPIELGGATSTANLWPQNYRGLFNAHDKDRLEDYLHQAVCSGKMPLRAAQEAIATNWVKAYCDAKLGECPSNTQ